MTNFVTARDTRGRDFDHPVVVRNDLGAEAAQLRRARLRERTMVTSGPVAGRGDLTLATGAGVLAQSVSRVEATVW
jgi:hypothetical protein